MRRDTSSQLSPVTIALHWAISITFICLLIAGIYMAEFEVYSLYPIHKSIGILVLVLALPRVIWRLMNGFPAPLYDKPIQHKVAVLVHWFLLLATLAMPISGIMMSGYSGHSVAIFGWELIASNPNPLNPMEVVAHNESLANLGHIVHELGKNVVIAVLLLHIAGALKHHFVDKDNTLRRMLGRGE